MGAQGDLLRMTRNLPLGIHVQLWKQIFSTGIPHIHKNLLWIVELTPERHRKDEWAANTCLGSWIRRRKHDRERNRLNEEIEEMKKDRIVRRELFFFTNKANMLTKSIKPEVGWAQEWHMPHSTTKWTTWFQLIEAHLLIVHANPILEGRMPIVQVLSTVCLNERNWWLTSFWSYISEPKRSSIDAHERSPRRGNHLNIGGR